MLRAMISLTIVLALGAGGCVAWTAVPSTKGKAYVVKGNVFGTSVYNCELTGGHPTCYRVNEVAAP